MRRASVAPTDGAKVIYLIKRREGVSRDAFIAHWYAHHMPPVIAAQERLAAQGLPHAHKYVVTLFDTPAPADWDGMAQLWRGEPLAKPDQASGVSPTDSFQERAVPYLPWSTSEYVIMDGELAAQPLTLNAPYPTTQSGFCKMSILLPAKAGADFDDFFDHWLSVHVPNVMERLEKSGGFRYVVNLSLDPANEPYAGLAELYFPDASGWTRYHELIRPDGMEKWVDSARVLVFAANTEMVGID